MKHPYRLILVEKDGVLVTELQVTENDLNYPQALAAILKTAIEEVEEVDLE